MLRKDKLEKFEYDRDMTEYAARFWNNEAVDEVIKYREENKNLDEDDSVKDAFIQQVDQLFGKGEAMRNHLSGKKVSKKETKAQESDDIKIVKKNKKG